MSENKELIGRLNSFLDRLANDAYAGTKFEADGDTLRDAMAALKLDDRKPTPAPHSDDAGRVGKVAAIATVPEYRIQWSAPDYGCQLPVGTHALVLATDLDAVTAELEKADNTIRVQREGYDEMHRVLTAERDAAAERAARMTDWASQCERGSMELSAQLAASQKECERLLGLLEDMRYELHQYTEGFDVIWGRVDAALATGGRHD